jgi:hypothetical protein
MRKLALMVLVGAVAFMGLLPPEHVHIGPDGRSYTHRHSILLSSRNPSLQRHEGSDHSHAIFLDPSFAARSMFEGAPPALTPPVFVLPKPTQTHGDVPLTASVRINGPPLRTFSSRGPPLA